MPYEEIDVSNLYQNIDLLARLIFNLSRGSVCMGKLEREINWLQSLGLVLLP